MATPECGQRAEAINSAVLAGRLRYARGSWGVSERVTECMLCLLFRFCEDLLSVYLGGRDRSGQGDDVWRCCRGADWARGGTGPA